MTLNALDLSDNAISTIAWPSEKCDQGFSWRTMDLSWNEIEEINSWQTDKLEFLDLQGNYLSDDSDYSKLDGGSYQVDFRENDLGSVH